MVGLALVAAAAIGAVATLGTEVLGGSELRGRDLMRIAGIGLTGVVGVVLGTVGVAAYVMAPARAGLAERNYASLRTAIAMLVLAAALSNLVQVPILLSDASLVQQLANGSTKPTTGHPVRRNRLAPAISGRYRSFADHRSRSNDLD